MTPELMEKINDPKTIDTIFAHIANGGSLIDLCSTWRVRFSDIMDWIYTDESRRKRYEDALEASKSWMISRLLQELRALSFIDVRKVFNDDHSLKPPSEWPDDVAAAISSIEVSEEWDKDEDNNRVKIGEIKKLKVYDKLRAIEMLGRDLGRFVNKVEHSGKLTLEDLITSSKDEKK